MNEDKNLFIEFAPWFAAGGGATIAIYVLIKPIPWKWKLPVFVVIALFVYLFFLIKSAKAKQ